MKRFLIDANLPRGIAVWQGEKFGLLSTSIRNGGIHYLGICSKKRPDDRNERRRLSHRIIVPKPPPRIIHIRVGNMRLREFERFVNASWKAIKIASANHKLVNVYRDRIEAIE